MKNNSKGLSTFLKRNAFYLILGLCIIAIALSVVIVYINKDNTSTPVNNEIIDDGGNKPVDTAVIFISPVAEGTIINEYCETVTYYENLNTFKAHCAIDFAAAEGTNVLAVYGGTVESVVNDALKGYTITIDHGNNLKTVYNSLSEDIEVTAGQTVAKGDIIGHVSTSNLQEMSEGAHLHFEVYENSAKINPDKYLVLDEK